MCFLPVAWILLAEALLIADLNPNLGGWVIFGGLFVGATSPDCARFKADVFIFCSLSNSLTTFLAMAKLYSSSTTVGSSKILYN